jgi:hypothetical protein
MDPSPLWSTLMQVATLLPKPARLHSLAGFCRSVQSDTIPPMPDYVDRTNLEGEPFVLKRIGADDYSVRIKHLKARRIMLTPLPGGHVVWFWFINGPYVPVHLLPGNGDTDTLAEAKAA